MLYALFYSDTNTFLLTEESVMNHIDEIIQAIYIGVVVGTFLYMTDRVRKAIELCRESLVLLNNRALEKEEQFGKFLYEAIYKVMFAALFRIRDYTNAITYGRKLLAIKHGRDETVNEWILCINLAAIYEDQNKYVEAKELYERATSILNKTAISQQGAEACLRLRIMLKSLDEFPKAKEYIEKALANVIEIGDRKVEGSRYGNLGTVFYSLGDYVKAKEYIEKALAIATKIGDREGEGSCYVNLGAVFISLGDYVKAKEHIEKALAIAIEIGDRKGEGTRYGNLGTVFMSLGDYVKAKEYIEKALAIAIEIGDREGEGTCYGNLGTVFYSLGDYVKAKEYIEKALAIAIEIRDREGEGSCYENLGAVFMSLGDYVKAKEYIEKALAIAIEIRDREGEGSCYENLGAVFMSLGDYVKAKEYIEKALAIAIEIGNRKREGTRYGNLGTVFYSLGDYVKAKEDIEKALAIAIEIRDRNGEGSHCENLGTVFTSLGDYVKAKEYIEKALAIAIEIGDRKGEGTCYGNLGTVFMSLGDYVKAKEYIEKALAIAIEIGDRKGEGSNYGQLAIVFNSLGDYVKGKEYIEKGLAIAIEIGDRKGEAKFLQVLGNVLLCLGVKYADANKYLEKALVISTQIGDRECEASCYIRLGYLFERLRNYVKAKEHLEKALAISVEIGNRAEEARIYASLGSLCLDLHEYIKAEEYLEKALSIVKRGVQLDFGVEISCYEDMAIAKLPQGKKQTAFPYLFQTIQKCEECRGFLKDNDELKVLYSDNYNSPYKTLSTLLCVAGNPNKALYVEELGRARGLSDLMAAQYSVERQISADPQSWTGIENVVNLESDSSCLYISYDAQNVLLWILKGNGVVEFRRSTVEEKTLYTKQAKNLDTFFNNLAGSFRSFGILPPELCEDRSFNGIEPTPDSSQEENLAVLRQGGAKDDPTLNLTLFHKMIIAPVANLLEGSEIIIVPDRHLYRVPFPALLDDSGKYLSETFRIRIVPSLTTLKCIQDSPADYHSQTGALIVGDPDVGDVVWKGRRKTISSLPFARKEAEMVGRLLGVQPLLGLQATKQAVLQRINSVSLIHFAAHGNEDKGEIILVPVRTGSRLPRETDCLLTVGDISQVQLRAKLVVLSCCHSARGQIKVEGVIGMARAFLGSGARSVLVALWALEDSATEQLMSRFYEHLYRGVSASESLHQAMEWMRDNGFAKVSEWAPFMLIGDNVTFDFGNKSKYKYFT